MPKLRMPIEAHLDPLVTCKRQTVLFLAGRGLESHRWPKHPVPHLPIFPANLKSAQAALGASTGSTMAAFPTAARRSCVAAWVQAKPPLATSPNSSAMRRNCVCIACISKRWGSANEGARSREQGARNLCLLRVARSTLAQTRGTSLGPSPFVGESTHATRHAAQARRGHPTVKPVNE